MEGSAVVILPRRTRGPVLRHPPEVLRRNLSSLVVVGTEFFSASPLGVRISEISITEFYFS